MPENNLSPIKKMALSVWDRVREQIINDCSDEEITKQMSHIHPDLRGTFKEKDFVSYDKALGILKMGYNRNKLNSLAKRYGIKNYTFNNVHIGFKKEDIMFLKSVISNKNNDR
jgi:hypothetical protein